MVGVTARRSAITLERRKFPRWSRVQMMMMMMIALIICLEVLPGSCVAFLGPIPALLSRQHADTDSAKVMIDREHSIGERMPARWGRLGSARHARGAHFPPPLVPAPGLRMARKNGEYIFEDRPEDGREDDEGVPKDYVELLGDLGPLPTDTPEELGEELLQNVPRHGRSSLLCIAAVPLRDGAKVICTGGFDNFVRLWEFTDPDVADPMDGVSPPQPPNVNQVAKLGGHVGPVFALRRIGEGLIASGGGTDREAKVWRLASDGKGGEPVASLPGHTGWVRDIAFDEDGSGGGNLYSIGCNYIKVWGPASEGGVADGDDDTDIGVDGVNSARRKDAVGGGKWGGGGVGESRLLGDLRVEGDQLRVACGGGYLFSAGIDGSLRAWRSPCKGNMGEPVKEVEGAHAGRVTGLAWADGHLYSCSHDGYVRMWSGGGPREEEVLSLIAEVDAKGYVGVYANEDERLMCMAISPVGEGVTGEINSVSGRYLYIGTSGGAILVVDRRPMSMPQDGEAGELFVLQCVPRFTQGKGGGGITSIEAVEWAEGRAGKVVLVGTSRGVLDTWQPAV